MKTIWACLGCAALIMGCGSSAQQSTASTTVEAEEYEFASKGKCIATKRNHEVSQYDTSGDARPDVRKLFVRVGKGVTARLVLVCREADLNGDDVVDVVRLYDDEGRPSREEADMDFDGRIDQLTTYAHGRPVLREIDSNGSGLVDMKVFFEDGEAVRAERDMRGRSTVDIWQPDRWEYFEAGHVVRVGSDIDGDGKVDRWDRDEERLRKLDALARKQQEEAAKKREAN